MVDKKLDMDEKMAALPYRLPGRELHLGRGQERTGLQLRGLPGVRTCRFVCPLDAIEWSYPRGGFGVAYMWG
jgi:hypothetical protein